MPPAARIVLSHPGLGAFVQQVGRALYEQGLLKSFVTTLVDRPSARWRPWLTGALDTVLKKRTVTEFPTELVRTCAPRELLRLLAREMDWMRGGLTDAVWEWSEHGFDRWVAAHALEDATGVYGFEHACRQTFATARQRGLTCIYEVPAPEAGFVQRVRDEEIAAHPALDSLYERRVRAAYPRRSGRRREEFEMAHLVVASSEFTKSTYQRSGMDISKMCVVPLGAPPVCADQVIVDRQATAGKRPLRFLTVGTATLHKGTHHLLAAWRKFNPGNAAVLQMVGHVDLADAFFQGLGDSVSRQGFVLRSRMTEIYRQADVLVFPSLCDGFGMVVTEALSQGLPVITTPHVGASQMITPGVNGLIVPPGDAVALASALDWCLTHREELAQMNWQAREAAARWQWSDFRGKLMEEISVRIAL